MYSIFRVCVILCRYDFNKSFPVKPLIQNATFLVHVYCMYIYMLQIYILMYVYLHTIYVYIHVYLHIYVYCLAAVAKVGISLV